MNSSSKQNESTSIELVCQDQLGTYLESILEHGAPATRPDAERIEGVVVGTLVGLTGSGEPLVNFPANRLNLALVARSTVGLGERHIGASLVLMFEGGDLQKPLVMGILHNPVSDSKNDQPRTFGLQVDDDRVVVTGEREIVLRCGEASITLTKAGKVLIRGKYVLSRSSGVNRIKGGSVQIN